MQTGFGEPLLIKRTYEQVTTTEQIVFFIENTCVFFFNSRLQPLTNGFADDGDWSESSEEDHQGRYSPLVAMAMSGTNAKPPTGISPPRAQSPFNKASTPLNTTDGALGTSLNGSFALQGKKRIL